MPAASSGSATLWAKLAPLRDEGDFAFRQFNNSEHRANKAVGQYFKNI